MVDVEYVTFNREKTPPPVKTKATKARPNTARPTPLEDDNPSTSDIDEDEPEKDVFLKYKLA
jgi:hypothetical protein